jgi:hypothetical protein
VDGQLDPRPGGRGAREDVPQRFRVAQVGERHDQRERQAQRRAADGDAAGADVGVVPGHQHGGGGGERYDEHRQDEPAHGAPR